MFSRNIGLITKRQQKLINKSHVLICGVGGMGGVCAEALVRMGVGTLTIVDGDFFEKQNTNRQIGCNTKTYNLKKVKVLKKNFLKINPSIKINAISDFVSLKNIENILNGVDIVVNGMDQMLPSIILERNAKEKKIPIVDAWLTPFASVFVMDQSAPHWESFLKLKTKNKKIENISQEDITDSLKKETDFTLNQFDPYKYIDKKTVNLVIKNKIPRPSFVIVVWLSGILMANEVFKIIVGIPHIGYKGMFFNQYDYSLKKIKKIE